MSFQCSGDFVHALSREAATLYRHLGAAQPHLGVLLQRVFGLCCKAFSLKKELFAQRDHSIPLKIRNVHRSRVARAQGPPMTFDIWTRQGTWFWHVVDRQRTGGTIGATATEAEAIREAHSSIEEMRRRVRGI